MQLVVFAFLYADAGELLAVEVLDDGQNELDPTDNYMLQTPTGPPCWATPWTV